MRLSTPQNLGQYFFYRLNNYRLSLSFCSKNEKEAQEIARKFDDKVDFDYSYLEPVVSED